MQNSGDDMKRLVYVAILLLFSCAGLQKAIKNAVPKVTTGEFRVTNLSFNQIEFELDLHVANPNSFTLPVTGLDYTVQLGGKSIVSGKKEDNPKLAANQTTTVQIPFTVPFSSIKTIIGNVWEKDELVFDINTGLIFDIPVLGNRTIGFDAQQSVPVPKVPSVKLSGLKKKSVSFSGAKLELQVEVDNPNVVPISLSGLGLDFKVNGKRLVKSNLDKPKKVAKKEKAIIPIAINVDLFSAGSIITKLIRGGGEFDYTLGGNYDIKLDVPYFKPFKQDFSDNGKVKLR